MPTLLYHNHAMFMLVLLCDVFLLLLCRSVCCRPVLMTMVRVCDMLPCRHRMNTLAHQGDSSKGVASSRGPGCWWYRVQVVQGEGCPGCRWSRLGKDGGLPLETPSC
eukprot:1150333-Pelagomonas_calceolata.AAC.6